MKAQGDELACKASEITVTENGLPIRRGIISYYATSLISEATDMQSWLDMIEQESKEDLTHGKITILQKPLLQICGDPKLAVIGKRKQ